MKMFRCTFILALAVPILLGGVSAPARADINILQNPDFETGSLSPWVQKDYAAPGGEDWNVTDTDAHSGKFSATDRGNKVLRQSFAPVPTDSITELSFWEKGGGQGLVWLTYADGKGEGRLVYPGTNWTFIDIANWLDPGEYLTDIWVWGFDSPAYPDQDRTSVDDFRIMVKAPAAPEPGSLSLLGLGGLPLCLWRRRRQLRAR